MADSDSSAQGAVFRHAEVRESLPVFARNGEVVFSQRTRFPPYCVKCGAHAETSLRATLRLHPGWVYWLLLVNVILYALVATAMTKQAAVELPLCLHHAARRRQALLGGWAAFVGSLVLFVGALLRLGSGDSNVPCAVAAVAAVTALGSLIAVSRASTPLQPVEINDFGVRAKGASQAFLDKLPTGNW